MSHLAVPFHKFNAKVKLILKIESIVEMFVPAMNVIFLTLIVTGMSSYSL